MITIPSRLFKAGGIKRAFLADYHLTLVDSYIIHEGLIWPIANPMAISVAGTYKVSFREYSTGRRQAFVSLNKDISHD